MSGFDVDDFIPSGAARYERRISYLQSQGFYTASIESTVNSALANIGTQDARSFVIYGEPQSGKTEMMIALTARLLDEGVRIIIVLMNDSVQLLEQNLDRFLRSGLDPAPKQFNEILDPTIDVRSGTWVIFCKKNSADLQKLIAKLGQTAHRSIIDDEADYATPNSKINKSEKTRINELVETLLGADGTYIGVTATPARLDLNNTLDNKNEHWIDFPTHPLYTGQDTFFPTTAAGFAMPFRLELLPQHGDNPKYLRSALFSFLVNVAYLNTQINTPTENYCMLVHTSGKKVDHTKDYQQIVNALGALKDRGSASFAKYLNMIYTVAQERFPGHEKELTQYVVDHINQSDVVVMNSDTPRNASLYRRATSPAALFTVAIGGNIVSRGVTFDNLLSMFFTRDVKHKIQQDTYIQRARMFGTRGGYLQYFELYIPQQLYFDWQKCFVFHQLALSVIRAGKGSPIWLEDRRIAAVAGTSVDQAAVALDSGEMSWDLFAYVPAVDAIADDDGDPTIRLQSLADLVGDDALPAHVLAFIDRFNLGPRSIAIHKTTQLGATYGTVEERTEIRRRRGFIATNALEKDRFPDAIHHIKVFRNDAGNARVFYKYTPEMGKHSLPEEREEVGRVIRQVEQYHGVAIARLLRSEQAPAITVRLHERYRSAYALDELVALYVKYSTSRLSPWSFGFKVDHQQEIAGLRGEFHDALVALVCGFDGIVCLSAEEYARVLDERPKSGEWIRVARGPREKYVVTGSDSRTPYKIGDNEFPAKVYQAIRAAGGDSS